tara:strand:- start:1372 stop:1614 length:243 start_codon:yes stop_codon:yes gene_type:complete
VEQFTLINKQRNRIKIFKKFKSTLPQAEDVIEIEYACIYKRSSKPVIKGSRIETLEKAREEYKELLAEGWRKTSIYNHFL